MEYIMCDEVSPELMFKSTHQNIFEGPCEPNIDIEMQSTISNRSQISVCEYKEEVIEQVQILDSSPLHSNLKADMRQAVAKCSHDLSCSDHFETSNKTLKQPTNHSSTSSIFHNKKLIRDSNGPKYNMTKSYSHHFTQKASELSL